MFQEISSLAAKMTDPAMLSAVGMASAASVSYTHLDVYKRQIIGRYYQ